MAHVAVLTWCQRQVFARQIIQVVLFYHVSGLIAIAHYAIVLTASQLLESLSQIGNHHDFCTRFLQRVNHGPTGHQGYRQPLHVAQSIVALLAFSRHDLVIQSEHGARVVGLALAIRRIHHHAQVYPTVQHVASDGRPFIRRKLHGHIQALHQSLGKLHVQAAGLALLVHVFQWRVVLIYSEYQGFRSRIS